MSYGLNGLGAVRSLGQLGIPVIAIGTSPTEPGLRSRYCKFPIVLPAAHTGPTRFQRALEPYLGQGLPLIPTSDPAAEFISAHQEELKTGFRLAAPPPDALAALIDKRLEYELVAAAGVPMPRTVTRLSTDIEGSLASLGFPLILKPRTLEDSLSFGFKNLVVNSPAELESLLPIVSGQADRLVAQEVVSGDDDMLWVCNATFNSDSKLVCGMTFQRLGLSPAHFGVTTLARSIHNPVVKDYSARLGRRLCWMGPAMFEFKWDGLRQEYVYIEINPRLGMCNWFDTRCGVNNVLATYLLALGRESEIYDLAQTENLYYVSLVPDIFSRIEDGESIGGILKRHACLFLRRRVGAYFYWRDPLPALDHGFRQSGRVVNGLIRRVKSRVSPSRD